MSATASPQPDPSAIGGVTKAPYTLLPDPARLFVRRAERFEALAAGSALAPYLRFLAGISRAQAEVAAALPPVRPLDAAAVARAAEGAMPPLDRARLAADPDLHATLDLFLSAAGPIDKPQPAAEALDALRGATSDERIPLLAHVLAEAAPGQDLATTLYLAAGAQIHAVRLAATLDAAKLVPVSVGLCPACGGRPVDSLVLGVHGVEGARYAACSFCATQWNEVRVKCLACGSTKGVGYRSVEAEGEAATVKAEVCDECRSWVKILYQIKNPSLEAVADDVGTVGLDLLMRETDYRRAGFNPFLLGT